MKILLKIGNNHCIVMCKLILKYLTMFIYIYNVLYIYLLCYRVDNIKMKIENEEEEPISKKVK